MPGKRVLLIEARDRIGGRGTWIHWQMPQIYREVSLYGMRSGWYVS